MARRASQGALPSRHSSVSEPSPRLLASSTSATLLGGAQSRNSAAAAAVQKTSRICGNLFFPKISFFLAFTIVGDRLCHVRVLGLGGGGARAREGRSEAKMDLNHHLYEEAGTPDAGKPKKQEEEER